MIHLVLSLDYEFFGNGSGDVRRDMIEPTSRLLAISNKHTAKVSIMFEVGAYWAMKQAEDHGLLKLDYSPSKEIVKQIKLAVGQGHDVQLHLHPWWIGASFKDGQWHLNPNYVRISDLPGGIGSKDDPLSIVGVLSQGKQTLENMICPIQPDYKCLVYRAGAFCCQPSKDFIAGMKKAGFVADSSVVKGLYEKKPVITDYRDAESSVGYWWTSQDEISLSGVKGQNIIEFPVYSEMHPYLYNFKWTKFYTSLKRSWLEKINKHGHGMMKARNSSRPIGKILKELFIIYPFKYDFCKLGHKDMTRNLIRIIQEDRRQGNENDTILVMTGHSKDFWNDKNLERFLKYTNERFRDIVNFNTMGELSNRIMKKEIQYV